MKKGKEFLLGGFLTLLSACGPSAPPQPPAPPVVDPGLLLSVDTFGRGSVTANAGGLQCAGQVCTGTFENNASVTLSGVPEAGWRLDHWTGCDTVSGTTCTVQMNEPKLVQPYFVSVAEPIVSSDVVVLSEGSLTALQSDTNGVLVFDSSATQLKSVQVGQLLVSGQGEGFVRRVSNVISLENGSYFIDTTEGDIGDLFKNGTVIAQLDSLPKNGEDVWEAAEGVSLQALEPLGSDAFSKSFSFNLHAASGMQVTGQASIAWHPEVALEFGAEFGEVESAKLILNPRVKTELGIKVEGGQAHTLADRTIMRWRGAPRVVLVAGVPVVLIPTAEIRLKVTAEGNASLELKPSYTLDASAGVAYVRSAGVRPIGHSHGSGAFSIASAVKATLEATALAELPVEGNIRIYGIGGPTLTLTPYVSAAGEYNAQPDSTCLSFNAALSAKGAAGGKISLFKKVFSSEFEIFDRKLYDLWNWESRDCDDTPPTPPGALQFRESNGDVQIAWQASTDNQPSITYKVYREGSRIGDTLVAKFTDGSARPDTYSCYKVFALDKAGNKSTPTTGCFQTSPVSTRAPGVPGGLQATAKSTTSVDLSWTASSDAQVIGFQIFMNGKLRTTVPNTSGMLTVSIQKLLPEKAYCFTIRAYNAAGLTSDHSAPACATTLAPKLTAWTMKIGCQSRAYLFAKGLDLDVDSQSNVSVVGTANDYDGGRMAYHLHGFFSPSTRILTAVIDWTFEGTNHIRKDSFKANLATGDSGDVAMTQERVTGCDAKIRLVKGLVPLSTSGTTPTTGPSLFMR